jgi:hypothetical protein
LRYSWLYPFERYNKIMVTFTTGTKAVENQIADSSRYLFYNHFWRAKLGGRLPSLGDTELLRFPLGMLWRVLSVVCVAHSQTKPLCMAT